MVSVVDTLLWFRANSYECAVPFTNGNENYFILMCTITKFDHDQYYNLPKIECLGSVSLENREAFGILYVKFVGVWLLKKRC